MTARAHAAGGTLALVLIVLFWVASALAVLAPGADAALAVKRGVVWGLALLIPLLAATGLSGMRLVAGRSGRLIGTKQKRMALAAANGLCVMLPCALYLRALAVAGDFGAAYRAVQTVELAVGLLQIALLGLNLRDGLRLRRRTAASAALQS